MRGSSIESSAPGQGCKYDKADDAMRRSAGRFGDTHAVLARSGMGWKRSRVCRFKRPPVPDMHDRDPGKGFRHAGFVVAEAKMTRGTVKSALPVGFRIDAIDTVPRWYSSS